MKFTLPPTNGLVAFVGPYISLATGAVASWLVVHVELLGALHLAQTEVSNALAMAATGSISALITHFGFQKWLDGHQVYFCRLFDLVKELDPNVKAQVIAALPLVKGDLVAALGHVLPAPPALSHLATTSTTPPVDHAGDGSGDVPSVTLLDEIQGAPVDPLPDSFGNDAVHAPQTVVGPPPIPQAPPVSPAPTPGGAA